MVTMLTRDREARGEGIKAERKGSKRSRSVVTKVGSKLSEKIFVARKLFKNCLTLSD